MRNILNYTRQWLEIILEYEIWQKLERLRMQYAKQHRRIYYLP